PGSWPPGFVSHAGNKPPDALGIPAAAGGSPIATDFPGSTHPHPGIRRWPRGSACRLSLLGDRGEIPCFQPVIGSPPAHCRRVPTAAIVHHPRNPREPGFSGLARELLYIFATAGDSAPRRADRNVFHPLTPTPGVFRTGAPPPVFFCLQPG